MLDSKTLTTWTFKRFIRPRDWMASRTSTTPCIVRDRRAQKRTHLTTAGRGARECDDEEER